MNAAFTSSVRMHRTARLAAAALGLTTLVFGAWILLELYLGPGLSPEARERLHLARGLSSALLVAMVLVVWAERKAQLVEREDGRRKQHLAEVLKSSTDAIVGIDSANRIVYWSRGAEILYGYRPEEILGESFDRLLGGDTRMPDEIRLPGFSRAERLEQFLTERLAKDGSRIAVLVRRASVENSQRECMGCSAVEDHVRNLRELERQLSHSEQLAMVGEMAAGLAHEIKNPLAGIAGAVQVLAEDLEPQDERYRIVSKILEQVRRIDGTVRDLLTYARPKRARLEPTDLVGVIENALGVVGFLPSERLRIERRFQKDLPPALVDPELFAQVLSNLFINAVQAMPEGGTLSVSASSGPHGIRLAVSDSGCGIPREHLQRVFDPFFTTKTRGTGLGLPICRRIIEAHGGEITVSSPPGRGAEFVIRLPARPPTPALLPAETDLRSAAS